MFASRAVAASITVLLLVGCGRATVNAAAPIATGQPAAQASLPNRAGTKFPPAERAKFAYLGHRVIGHYDRNGDRMLGAKETPVVYQQGHTDVLQRTDDHWVLHTRISYDRWRALKGGMLAHLDIDRNEKISVGELLDPYLMERDTNGNGEIGLWERIKIAFVSVSGRYEDKWVKETGREQWWDYDPRGDSDRPRPPVPREKPPQPVLQAPPDNEE